MITANALKTAFNGLELTYFEYLDEVTKASSSVTKSVKFHFGDQKELNKWVANRGELEKFPLIWYVLAPYDSPRSKNYIEVNARIILFTSTQAKFYNNTRQIVNYNEILNPLKDLVMQKIHSVNYIDVVSIKELVKDEPNYGVDTDRTGVSGDFTSESPKGTRAISLTYLDAKVIDMRLRVHPIKCINN